MHIPTTCRTARPLLAVVLCTSTIVACGSARKPVGTGGDSGPLLAYAQCMRAHDVPNFPDPSAAGGLVIPNDINTDAPAFQTAQHACEKLAAQPASAGSSESRKLQLVALARCMRAHGVPSFPDPTSSPPPPSSGNVIGAGGWYLALGTQQERQSPAYRQAASGCRLGIR
jgi:hypothetical protein